MKKFRRSHSESEQDFELNLASIIDCFTVLIAFLLVSASFVSIGVLDAEVAASGSEVTEKEDSPVQLVIDLKSDRSILVYLSGQINRIHRIQAKTRGEWNFDALTDRLAIVKGEWPALKSATLLADNKVAYRDVVKSMEVARLAVPTVNLGGF